jgi:integrase
VSGCRPGPSGTTRTSSPPSPTAGRSTRKSDYDDWTRLLQKAGVRHVRLHDARHTAATPLLSENVHPRVVRKLLGRAGVAGVRVAAGCGRGPAAGSARSALSYLAPRPPPEQYARVGALPATKDDRAPAPSLHHTAT